METGSRARIFGGEATQDEVQQAEVADPNPKGLIALSFAETKGFRPRSRKLYATATVPQVLKIVKGTLLAAIANSHERNPLRRVGFFY